MLVKAVTIFLIAMMVLAMFGKLRMPKLPRPGRRKGITSAGKCRNCGAPIPGKGPCPCRGNA